MPLVAAGISSGVEARAGQNASEQEIATQDVQSTFKLQVQRNMVLVRVIVRDSNGRPAPGLRKEDFRLWDNGKPQEIDQFSVESPGSASPKAAPARGVEAEGEAAPEAGPAQVMARNYQALYFDDTQMTLEDVAHARDAADRYLAATLTPADRVGIFTSSGQANLDFTGDRSKLHEALLKLQPRPQVGLGLTSCPDIGEYQAYLIDQRHDADATNLANTEYLACIYHDSADRGAQAIAAAQASIFVAAEAARIWNQWQTQSEAVLRGLEAVVRGIALLPGQRSVIFLSPGFLIYNREFQVAQVVDRALRAGVVINVLDPRGLYTLTPGDSANRQDTVVFRVPDYTGKKGQIVRDGISLDEQVLYGFAEDTGGQFFHNSNDLDQGFRQVGTLAEIYYVLAFSPHSLKFDGRFHKLKVSLVNPGGYTLQARRGYFAPKESEDAASRAKEEIIEAALSRDDLRELPIDVHTQFYKINQGQARLAVLTHLDLSSLRFRQEQGRHLSNLTFETVLFDRDGKCVEARAKQVELRLRDATLARLQHNGITLKMEFDLKPGTYLVRQIVRESEAGQLSGLSRTVEIPY
jgi:VWFA-related protein